MRISMLLAVLTAWAVSGCANLESIARRSTLPASDGQSSRAIHLDAKQRLIFAKDGIVCAEPSPDALSAFAASGGAGASAPSQGAATLTGAINTAAASFGLRTQSITLMRDSLYRVCEAYYSGKISEAQVMLLLARSQDLTATVVAVEQLTGAVVAQQAILSGSANAQASAAMVGTAEALERIQALSKKNQDDLAAATERRERAEQERNLAREAVAATEAELNNTAEEQKVTREKLQAKLAAQQAALAQKETVLESRTEAELLAEKQLENTRRVELEIAQKLDSAIASSAAGTATSGEFGADLSRDNLDEKTVEHIAFAVRDVVGTALRKDYVSEMCIAILTHGDSSNIDTELRISCRDLIQGVAIAKIESLGSQMIQRSGSLMERVGRLSNDAAIRLSIQPPVSLPADVRTWVDAQDPNAVRRQADALFARDILRRMISRTSSDPAALAAWEEALR